MVTVHHIENAFGSLIPARVYFHLKTVMNFEVALVLVPILAVPMLLLALAIRIDSRGPALFRQRRLGLAGKPITVYKFRTMEVHDAGEDERSAAMTGAGDDRITRLGGFLRRSRIDELPQVINILKGEMSWIGPRPEALVLSNWYVGEKKSPSTAIATSFGRGFQAGRRSTRAMSPTLAKYTRSSSTTSSTSNIFRPGSTC